MLILSRKPGDAVLIDGGIRVVVLSSDSGGVRLGIEAPASVGIVREEIARDIAEENQRAGAGQEARAWLESLGGRVEGSGDGEPSAPGSAGEGGPEEGSPDRA